jgi:SAM-dependent methyltransferase
MANSPGSEPSLSQRIKGATSNLPVIKALRDLERRQRELEVRLEHISQTADRMRELAQPLAEQVGQIRHWLAVTSERGDATAGSLEAFIADQQRSAERLHAALVRIEQHVAGDAPLHGGDAFALETFESEFGATVVGYRDDHSADRADEVYLGFETFFRGSEEEIRERQRIYLPLLKGHSPVLDIGCGRGELLELLRDAGVPASGIDLDSAMVRRCQEKGLDAVQGDAVTHLEEIKRCSLGAVSAAQLIEHLPYGNLLRFLRASRTALDGGGVLLLETVNPHAPQALKHFWIDPTHQHPLFGETVLALCRLTGFAEAYIWYPAGSGDPEQDRVEQLDYAVVARTVTQDAPTGVVA